MMCREAQGSSRIGKMKVFAQLGALYNPKLHFHISIAQKSNRSFTLLHLEGSKKE